MAVNLHPECRARLVEVVSAALPHINVKHGMFLDLLSAAIALRQADEVLLQRGPLRDQLVAYVDERPISGFISDSLSLELQESNRYLPEPAALPLTALAPYVDTRAVAEQLVRQLESLPRLYTTTLKLSDPLSALLRAFVGEFALAPSVRLVRPGADFADRYPLNSENEGRQRRVHQRGLLLNPRPVEWDATAVYLQVETSGFIGPYGGSTPDVEARRTVKAICGLGLALYLFQVERTYSPVPTKSYLYVHRRNDNGWEIDNKLELDDDAAKLITDLRISTLRDRLNTDELKIGWALRTLTRMQKVFSAGSRAASILLASQWLFDSYTGHDELLNFVRAMVVLEILLGDDTRNDEIGLGELLRNRCAYLIAANHAQRTELLRDFADIYHVRSQIVHRGKHRLSNEERGHLHKLLWLCDRVIQREVELLETER